MQFGVGALICHYKVITSEQAIGISNLIVKIFNLFFLVGIVSSAFDTHTMKVLPIFLCNMIAVLCIGYRVGTIVGKYCQVPYFKNTLRAIIMCQNYFVLPTTLPQEVCAYGFLNWPSSRIRNESRYFNGDLTPKGDCQQAITFIGLSMAINNLITNSEVGNALKRDTGLKYGGTYSSRITL